MRVNRAIKRAAIAAGRLLPQEDPSTRRVVLCYHSVHPNRPYFSSTPELFERHLQWLKQHCHVTSLVELVIAPRPTHSGKPAAAITFDDGLEDNHSYALPILAKYGISATFFITAGFVERDPTVLRRFQRLFQCSSDEVVPLSWSQVREMRAAGMDIGAHTYTHPNLASLSGEEAGSELRKSKQMISDRIGCDIDLFAYPFGKPNVHFTSATTDIVKATGYRIAAAVTYRGVRESDPLLSIPRFFNDGDTIAKLEAKVRGVYDLIGWWQDHAPLTVMRIVSPEDFHR